VDIFVSPCRFKNRKGCLTREAFNSAADDADYADKNEKSFVGVIGVIGGLNDFAADSLF
jgi:hypothetical protein